jgi:ribosomal-protein-alanine N-acetyltransferase
MHLESGLSRRNSVYQPLVARVLLERPTMQRATAFLRALRGSRALHRGWVSPPGDRSKFARYVESLRGDNRDGFFVVTEGGDIAGVVNVNEIVRGSFKSAYLGYYALEPFDGRGFLRSGLRSVISYCFGELRLHRLEANIQPENARSIALVEGLGFQREGLSPRYLKVCGRWRDHERWALLSDNWRRKNKVPARIAHRAGSEPRR